jgi:hypothetical protein
MEAFQKNKNAVIVGVIILVLVGAGLLLTRGGDSAGDGANKRTTLPDVEVFPTVDASVIVKLEPDKLMQNVTLSVDNYPASTSSLEYELSYDALVDGEPIPKGVIGTIEVDGEETISKEITLGTCSSGTCKYDDGIKSIHVTLKFVGSYGAKLFTGDFKM